MPKKKKKKIIKVLKISFIFLYANSRIFHSLLILAWNVTHKMFDENHLFYLFFYITSKNNNKIHMVSKFHHVHVWPQGGAMVFQKSRIDRKWAWMLIGWLKNTLCSKAQDYFMSYKKNNHKSNKRNQNHWFTIIPPFLYKRVSKTQT